MGLTLAPSFLAAAFQQRGRGRVGEAEKLASRLHFLQVPQWGQRWCLVYILQLENQEWGETERPGFLLGRLFLLLSEPNNLSKGFVEAPVQAGTIGPGPPGSGGRREDRLCPGRLLTWGSSHSLTWNQTQQHTFTANMHKSIHSDTFSHTRPHVYTCTYILIHKHAHVKPDLQNASVRALAFTHMTTDTTPRPTCTSKQAMFM